VLFFNKPNPSNRTPLRMGVLAALAVLVLAAMVAGCGGGSSEQSSPTHSAAPAVSKADLHEAQVKSRRLAKLYERSWREYQNE
jgi:hypothetical protein